MFSHLLASFGLMVSLASLASCLILTANASAYEATVRLVGGVPTTIDNAPYLVQLRRRNGDVVCGGTLVSTRHVVTAGHCFNKDYYGLMVVVGGVSTLDGKGVERLIEDLTIHPDYNSADMHSDVAIALLDQPMTGNNIRTVPLCGAPLKPDAFIQVSGWGRTAKDDKLSHQLQTVRLPVTTTATCQKEFGRYVEKNMFCASGREAKGICMGDSGGPAIYDGQLCGIVAFVHECGVVGNASAFTDVYALRTYIKSVMEMFNYF